MRCVRVRDGKFDEEKGQKREYCCLYEAYEHLKTHQGYREYVRHKESSDREQYFASENVTKKTEGKGDKARDLADKLDETHYEIHGR